MASELRKKLQAQADTRGVQDPLFVVSWREAFPIEKVVAGDGRELVPEPSHEIAPSYRRADGRPRLRGHKNGPTAMQKLRESEAGC